MPDATQDDEIAYHLLLDPPEAEITGRALRLLVSDEAHEPTIRALAREAIDLVEASPGAVGGEEGEWAAGGEEVAGSADTAERADAAAPPADASPGAAHLTVPLTAPQMKILHTAVKLLLLDTQREQEPERQLLHAILAKLPDEHALRAITL
jgi:hypothetical protein